MLDEGGHDLLQSPLAAEVERGGEVVGLVPAAAVGAGATGAVDVTAGADQEASRGLNIRFNFLNGRTVFVW